MQYFFILGKNTALSIAEVLAVVKPKSYKLLTKEFFVVETEQEIVPERLIQNLGGIVKIGEIKEQIKSSELKNIVLDRVIKLAAEKKKMVKSGKFNFGFSDYTKRINIQDVGLKLKKEFKSKEVSSRFVVSRDEILSSVVVEQNKLISRGIELNFVFSEDKVLIGETLAVQPFKTLSFRDFGRPARDDKSGMIPPKLAQIMINLAELSNHEDLIVDPFCGSGTIISEAMVMGYKNLFGTDVSFKAITDSRKNIEWIKEKFQVKDVHYKLAVKNVLDLSKFVKNDSVSAFITEPYLGPQRGKIDFVLIIKELDELYTKALDEIYKALLPGGRVVMVWPVFYGERYINPITSKFKKIKLIPDNLRHNANLSADISDRETIMYGRKGQKVFREIIVLEK